MEKQQAIDLVSKTFTRAFNEELFHELIVQLLNHFDDSPARQSTWAGQYIKQAFRDRIKSYKRIGTYTDPEGNKLDVLIINLKNEPTLERGRTLLRNFAADYLATGHGNDKDAVLAAYVSPNGKDWRFSHVKLEYTLEKTEQGRVRERKELTPARRYSFLVGANEKSHTAQKQFLPLFINVQSDPKLEEIEKAFDIEKVTKEFFEQYKKLFEETQNALQQVIEQDAKIAADFEEKSVEPDNFAKKLLGQIVFLYFLQKKGWFGVERDQAWGTGRKDYLRHLFATKRPDENYFNDILEPLFYYTLAVERRHVYSDRFKCKIPFLNGGLFEPLCDYDWVHMDINLPDELFSNKEKTKDGDIGTGILDVFDRYNFTVNEAEPLETEVAVDPEMLGKVFENLLPENLRHKGGTYYTPRVIVNYMCQQSLINYLATHLEGKVNREDVETFITRGEVLREFEANQRKDEKNILPESIRNHAKEIDRLLEVITVCDPAVGSGAFLVGMMQEIVKARCTLAAIEGMPEAKVYELKRHAIESSLYGVDYDPGAVEIARLRLWLSLVVDENDRQQIEPLPNLDYKIMQGNSLLEEFRGVKLYDDDLFAEAFVDKEAQLASLNQRINELQDQFFELDRQGIRDKSIKQKFVKEIDALKKQKRELLSPAQSANPAQVTFQDLHSVARQKLAELKRLHKEFFDQPSGAKKRDLRDKLDELEWEFMQATLKERGENETLRELEKHRRDNRKEYFLWKIHFLEVFQHKGGFDVVVANPPYVRADSGEEHLAMRKAVEQSGEYKTLWEKWDLYVAFIERGYMLLRPIGTMTMIVSDAYCHSKYAQKSQTWFLKNSRILRLDFLSKIQIFEAAVRNIIFFFANADGSTHKPERRVHDGEFGNMMLLPTAPQTELSYRAFFPEEEIAIPFNVPTLNLSSICYISFGCRPNSDERKARGAFVVADLLVDKPDSEHPKPYIEAKDTDRWIYHQKRWLEWGTSRSPAMLARPTFEELYEVPAKIVAADVSGAQNRAAYDDKKVFHSHTLISVVPWHSLSGVKNNSLKKSARYEDEKPPRPDLPRRKELEQTSRSFSLKYLLAVMNSNLARHFLRANRRSNIHLYPDDWKNLPIAVANQSQQSTISNLVDYIIFLKTSTSEESPRDQLMISYFEQLIDALVYELYLTDEIHAAGKGFFEPLIAENLPALDQIKGNKLDALRQIFERLFDRNHIIRQNIFFLDTIESVRIIEGKA